MKKKDLKISSLALEHVNAVLIKFKKMESENKKINKATVPNMNVVNETFTK